MARIPDTPKVARRREREKRTISNMVAIYCAGNHEATARTETSHAGEALCPACKAIDDYCVLRTERCRPTKQAARNAATTATPPPSASRSAPSCVTPVRA